MRIGIVGLGIIGSRMAGKWRQAGHEVKGWNRTRSHGEQTGVPLADTPRELAEWAETVMIVVADPPALDRVVSDADGISRTSLAGRLVMNASTVGAGDNLRAERAIHAAGGTFLETPFTGSKAGAETGALVFYVGGDPAVLKRAEPQLMQIGRKIFHFGPVGSAADTKLIMNMMLANLMQAMVEGFVFGAKAGLDMKTFVEAYKLNAGYSALADMKIPKMIERDFSTHFSLKHMDKDVRLALTRAAELKIACPLTERLSGIFGQAMAAGMGDEDFAALYELAATQAGLKKRG